MKIGSRYINCMLSLVFLLIMAGCAKEYSYEGGLFPDSNTDSIPYVDTVADPELILSDCAECNELNGTLPATWNFKYASSFVCGGITNAIITQDRTAFTFFGPSACSTDTGLVMTVYLHSDTLNSDRSNIIASEAFLQYYDNITYRDIFLSDQQQVISLTINTYEHATGIAKGTFSGKAFTKEKDVVSIEKGNFQIKFQ